MAKKAKLEKAECELGHEHKGPDICMEEEKAEITKLLQILGKNHLPEVRSLTEACV